MIYVIEYDFFICENLFNQCYLCAKKFNLVFAGAVLQTVPLYYRTDYKSARAERGFVCSVSDILSFIPFFITICKDTTSFYVLQN